ncbi:MAG: MurR/RpiR family transcriptional regulator [Bombilactobacillus mellifer]|nr:MurR/RpiR family transcriptional regulator [Bombilactobacillus mellifer]
MKFEEVINKYADRLTKSDLDILNFILKDKEYAASLKTKELAKKTFTSPSGLTRLAKRLHFSGFSEMKYFLENDTKIKEEAKYNSVIQLSADLKDTIKLFLQIDMVPIMKKISQAHFIYVYGTDWGEQIAAQLLTRNFLATQLNMIFIPSITELKWQVKTITPKDLLILISYSGENLELKELIKMIKVIKSPSISITPITHNFLSTKTDYNIYYQITDLKLGGDYSLEYNHFSPLYVVIDLLFRYYLDYHKKENQKNSF